MLLIKKTTGSITVRNANGVDVTVSKGEKVYVTEDVGNTLLTNYSTDFEVAASDDQLKSFVVAGVIIQPTYDEYFTYASGVLTAGSNASLNSLLTKGEGDGVTYAAGDNVLVAFAGTNYDLETYSHAYSGIYTITQLGSGSLPAILTRHELLDEAKELNTLDKLSVFVKGGTRYKGLNLVLIPAGETLGTSAINIKVGRVTEQGVVKSMSANGIVYHVDAAVEAPGFTEDTTTTPFGGGEKYTYPVASGTPFGEVTPTVGEAYLVFGEASAADNGIFVCTSDTTNRVFERLEGVDGVVFAEVKNGTYAGLKFAVDHGTDFAPTDDVTVTQLHNEARQLVGAEGNAAFANSWVTYGGTDYAAPAYRFKDGRVQIVGAVKSGTLNGTAEVFTLPAGYRPNRQLTFSVYTYDVTGVADDIGAVQVQVDGKVVVITGDNELVDFGLIEFELALPVNSA